jgi:hypothetical protein
MSIPAIVVNRCSPRAYTNALLEAVDSGLLTHEELIGELLRNMTESEVKEFVESCYLLRDDDNNCVIG